VDSDLLSEVNVGKYSELVAFVTRYSALFSNNAIAAVDSRFVEKLFCRLTGSVDLGRSDKSYDAAMPGGRGVGIKTFIASPTSASKTEKVAEFGRDATAGKFLGLSHEETAFKVAELRNARVTSDAAELGLNLETSFYHCLVRTVSEALIHEEPYPLVDLNRVQPTSSTGNPLAKFPEKDSGHVYFSDGTNQYTYNVSKNVLLKKFYFTNEPRSESFPTPIEVDIWDRLLEGTQSEWGPDFVEVENADPEDFVVLPLFSLKGQDRVVPARSGINQWNANGRARKFGEAYIPVPRLVHTLSPNFFPARDVRFDLTLPDGTVVNAKLCQDNSKALMSDPNDALCNWLFRSIDGSLAVAQRRLADQNPYTYNDLATIGKDSVKISRGEEDGSYFMEMAPCGSFDDFVAHFEDPENLAS
jgi:hypothetical protein